MKKIWQWILIIFVVILIAVRMALPSIVLKKANQYLETFSPVYTAHIQDLSLNIWRMAYTFNQLNVRMKANNKLFLNIDEIDVSIAWREIFKGRLLTDVVTTGADFFLNHEVINGTKSNEATPKQDAKNATDKLFPLRITRIELREASFQFGELMSEPQSERWKISGVEGVMLNVNPVKTNPITFFTLKGSMFDRAAFKSAGKLKRLETPLAWKSDIEIQRFDLVAANPIFKRTLPLTFTSGELDLYSEVKSENGTIRGYVKPFLTKLHVIGNKNDFQSPKHFFIEIMSALGNAILRKSDTKTVAMRIPFHTESGEFKIDTGEAIETAIENGFGKPVPAGIENSLDLK